MTITDDWQIELPDRGLVIGVGTRFTILRDPVAPRGFAGGPTIRTSDVERRVSHGDIPARDTRAGRLLSIPIGIDGQGATDAERQADAMATARSFLYAWRLATIGLVQLDARLPGMPETVVSYLGRPRDVTEQDWTWTFGRLTFVALFAAVDPAVYGAQQTLAGQTGTFTVPAADLGEQDTRWFTLAVHGNGGTPAISNETTGGDIVFTTTLAGGQTYTIDGYAQSVLKAGITRDVDVNAASMWFPLSGGVDNTLTLSGAADVDVTWRAAYQ